MSDYLLATQLQPSSYLFSDQQRKLNDLVNRLTIDEVKTDNAFAVTAQRIKESIVFVPVEFLEPKISGHEPVNHQMTIQRQMVGGLATTFNVTVEFPFSGSPELFGYSPKAMFGGTRFYQPNHNSSIYAVANGLGTLDKNRAIQDAREKISDTIALVKQVSAEAKVWSDQIISQIDAMLIKKRDELIAFYS